MYKTEIDSKPILIMTKEEIQDFKSLQNFEEKGMLHYDEKPSSHYQTYHRMKREIKSL